MRPLALLPIVPLLGILWGCDAEPEPVAQVAANNALGFARWEEDFPIAVELSPRRAGRWYDRSRRQALEKVISNLEGGSSRGAWLFAKDFFNRAPEEAIQPLIEAMDRAFPSPARAEMVQNAVQAMGVMGDPRFAEALLRALEHSRPGVRIAAMQALGRSGTPDAVRKVSGLLPYLDLDNTRAWLESARMQLGDAAVPLFAELLAAGEPVPADLILEQVMKMSLSQAASLLDPLYAESRGEQRIAIAGVLHGIGDGKGTVILQQALRVQDPAIVGLALDAASQGDLRPLLNDVLRATVNRDPAVRAKAVVRLADFPGQNVTDALQVLAIDAEWEVQSEAMRALVSRGHREELDRILEQIRTVSGSAMSRALDLVIACRDGKAVPVIMERFNKTPPGEGRGFLQAIAFTRSPEAFGPLRDLFLGPERAVEPPPRFGRTNTTLNYLPTLMLNVEGAEREMIRLFEELPEEDIPRRAYVLDVLGKIAVEREGQEIATELYNLLRSVVFDRAELPQMRLAALRLLRRDLNLDDAMKLKRSLTDEEPAMRKALSDFLFDLF